MSVEIINKQIVNFLTNDIPEVLAISGAWGVGKTYTWNKFLKKANVDNNISLKKYSYVSLFGINSLDAFKYAIFENVIDKSLIGSEPNLETFKKNKNGLTTSIGRKALSAVSEMPFIKNFSSAIELLSFLSVTNIIICIDDIERKGSKLELKDVLGLVSQLKEQKKCKIVLLINDNEEGLEDYVKYREKVIDLELKFTPSAAECALIAYDGEEEFYVTLRELTEKLNIRNIRVLKKIERLIKLAQPYTVGLEEEVKFQFIQSLTLFAWCYLDTGKEAPDLNFVTKSGYSFYGIGEEKDDSDEEKKWKALLIDYGYQTTDGLDLVLAEAVRAGYFVDETVNKAASEKNQLVISTKSEDAFSAAWRLYHDNFADNQQEVINTIYESFKRNVSNIAPNNLNGTVKLLRDFGENAKATELIDLYIKTRATETSVFNLEESNYFGDITDGEIVTKFEATYLSAVKTESAKQVLARVSGNNSWQQSDEVILANATVDEYYEIFKSAGGRTYISTCLKFGQFQNPNSKCLIIAQTAKEALIKIANESELNRRRVKMYGVEVNKNVQVEAK